MKDLRVTMLSFAGPVVSVVMATAPKQPQIIQEQMGMAVCQ